MIPDTSINFYQLNRRQQGQTLLQASSLEELQKVVQLSNHDKDTFSNWMVQWFKANIVNSEEQSLHTFRTAIQLQRTFKLLLNENFSRNVLQYFSNAAKIPRMNMHFNRGDLTKEELYYLWRVAEDFKLENTHIQAINNILDSFDPAQLNFEVMEATLYILGSVNKSLDFWVNRLHAMDSNQRKQFLVKVQMICASSCQPHKRRTLLRIFFKLTPGQQENILTHLIEMKQDGFKLRSLILKGMTYLPEVPPAEIYPSLKRLLTNLTACDEISLKFLKLIPTQKCLNILALLDPHLKPFKNYRNLQCLFQVLALMPDDQIKEIAAKAVNFFCWINERFCGIILKKVEQLWNKSSPSFGEIFDFVLFHASWLQKYNDNLDDPSQHILNLINTLFEQPPLQIKELHTLLEQTQTQIKSSEQWIGVVKTLFLFRSDERQELADLIISLQDSRFTDCISMALSAFPQQQRKSLLLKSAPYITACTTQQHIQELIISMGLSSRYERVVNISRTESLTKEKKTLPPLLTFEKLKKEGYACGLFNFIARYFGDENNPITISAGTQWVHKNSLQVFHHQALFFRELASNAFDAQLPGEIQIGNFGIGFYSVLSLFYQTIHPIDRIEIDTCYIEHERQEAYLMIFTKDSISGIQIQWKTSSKSQPGTFVTIYPKTETKFSMQFFESLKEALQDFRYFQPGYVVLDDNIILGNNQSKIAIEITLNPEYIQVRDWGCGIALSRLHYLLIPGISSKRNPSPVTPKSIDPPTIRSVHTDKPFSSVVFTINSVVNSVHVLDHQYLDSKDKPIDLLVELSKAFKPNLSRDGLVIPGVESPQAKAVCSMILRTIKDVFNDPDKLSANLLLLYFGLIQWEDNGLSAEFKGFFSSFLQTQLRKELEQHPECIPCYDYSWMIKFKQWLFGDESSRYIPLARQLVPEGYMTFENAVIKRYQDKILPALAFDQDILKAAAHRRMIEGLSVCFIDDFWLSEDDDHAQVSCGFFNGILLAPLSLLHPTSTFNEIQRKLCQRFADEGKKIQPYTEVKPSPFFTASIYIPASLSNMSGSYFHSASVHLLETYHACANHYLNSPVVKSLDWQKCKDKFWNYYPLLSKLLKKTTLKFESDLDGVASCYVMFEDVSASEAYLRAFNNNINWQKWFQEVLVVDYPQKKVFKIGPNADIGPLCLIMKSKRNFLEAESQSCKQKMLLTYPDYFEPVPDDELFKRLCVLMLIQWGLDPYIADSFFCYVGGVKKPIDITVFEQGINSYLIDPQFQDVNRRAVFYGGSELNTKGLLLSDKMAPFTLLFSNLNVFFKPLETLDLVHNFHDLYLIQKETPDYCTPYFEQLFDLFYDYLKIPSNEFSYRYGTKNNLRIDVEQQFFSIEDSIPWMRKISQHQSEKLLQGLVARFAKDLDRHKRFDYLQADMLKIRRFTGFNTLCLLTLCYDNKASNLPLINHLISLSNTNVEIAALALIICYAQKLFPAFFQLPTEYQQHSLDIILQSVLRTKNSSCIDYILDMDFFMHPDIYKEPFQALPSAIRTGIDCIELFASRYQILANKQPVLFQNPEQLFEAESIQIFTCIELMETLFQDSSSSDILAANNIEALLKKIQITPLTSRFDDFGSITSSTSQEGGYCHWELPCIELLKNSFEASKEVALLEGGEIKIDIKYALLPKNAEHMQLVYEISDEAGFEDLEALIGMLIPGFHPKKPQHLGLGFFRMLANVSVVYYQTRLQKDKSKAVTLIVQPLRNPGGDITDLKIGLSFSENSSEAFGTVCRVYFQPQKNIEAYMRIKQVHHFIRDTLKKCYCCKPIPSKITVNGAVYATGGGRGLREIMPESPYNLFGGTGGTASKTQGYLLVEGFPHSMSLNKFLTNAGFLPSSFSNMFKGGFISLPNDCLISLQDPAKLIVTPQALPIVQKYVLDWLYFHLFSGETRFLENFEGTNGNYDQLIPSKLVATRTPSEWIQKLAESHDYHEFFNHYSYSMDSTINKQGEKNRVPSFAEYLVKAYKEVYPQWLRDKLQGKALTFETFENWKKLQVENFNLPIKNTTLSYCNRKLLNLVKVWYEDKFQAFLDIKPILIRDCSPKGRSPQGILMPVKGHPILFSLDAKWRRVQSFIEEILTFYATEVLSHNQMNSTLHVFLCADEGFSGQQCKNTLLISVFSHPFSQLLSLIGSLERKQINAHYLGDLICSENPSQAGTLNHEIYHAFLYLKGDPHQGHGHEHGINFEVRAKTLADVARTRGVLTLLENKIRKTLENNSWAADTLKILADEAECLEKSS